MEWEFDEISDVEYEKLTEKSNLTVKEIKRFNLTGNIMVTVVFLVVSSFFVRGVKENIYSQCSLQFRYKHVYLSVLLLCLPSTPSTHHQLMQCMLYIGLKSSLNSAFGCASLTIGRK